MKRRLSAIRSPRTAACPARLRLRRRRGDGRHLPQRAGIAAQRSQMVKLSGAQLHPRRLRRRPADHGRQEDRRVRLPDPGGRPRPRNRRHRAAAQRHPDGGAAQGLPRRCSCGPAAARSYEMRVFPLQQKVQLVRVTAEGTKFLAIAKNVGGGQGRQQSQRAAPAGDQRHQRPGKGQGQPARLPRLRHWSSKRPTTARANSQARPRPSPSAPPTTASAWSPASTTSIVRIPGPVLRGRWRVARAPPVGCLSEPRTRSAVAVFARVRQRNRA